jgi:predicted PurR-regulated permease PerM
MARRVPLQGAYVVVSIKLPPAEVARAALVVLGIALAAYLVWQVQEILFLLLLALLLATAIEPLVKQFRRGPFTRGSGVLAVYTLIIVIICLPAYVFVPNVLGQAAEFSTQLPDRLEQLRPYAGAVRPQAMAGLLGGILDDVVHSLQAPEQPAQEQIVQAGTTAAHTLFSFVTVFVLAFYWLVERASIKRVLLRTVSARRARDVNTVWMEVEDKLGGWVRGQIILMLAVGCMATLGYIVLGLPNPALLGVIAGLCEIIPMVGPFLAFAPAVLVALATVDPTRALMVVAYALVIQQLDSNVLVPRVMGRTVGVSPLAIVLGILLGGALAGLPGAFVAVPIAGAVQVILAHTLRSEDASQAEEHTDPVDRAEHEGAPAKILAVDGR